MARDIGLPGGTTVGFADNATVRRRAGAPVDPPVLERQLTGRAGGESGDQLGNVPRRRVDVKDASATSPVVGSEQPPSFESMLEYDVDG